MTIKAAQLYASSQALAKLETCDLPFRASFQLERIMRKLQPEIAGIESTRQKLVRKFGDLQPDNSSFTVSSEMVPQFLAEFNSVLDVDLDLDIKPLDEASLEKAVLSAQDIRALRWLIVEAGDVK